MGTPMAPLRLLYSFSDAGRAAKTLLSASSEEELQQLVMQYDAIQHTICEHSIRRSLGPCQQGIKTGGACEGCCKFHKVLQESREKVEAWLNEGPKIHVECRIVCGDDEETVSMELRQRLSVEGAKRVLVKQAALQWEKNCVTEDAHSLRLQLASRVMAPEDVLARMGEYVLGDNAQTLESVGVETGATLNIVIAREAVEQKVAPVYDMVCWEERERERKIKREAEQQRKNEERRLRDEREVERQHGGRSYPGILLKQAWNKRECERKRQQEVEEEIRRSRREDDWRATVHRHLHRHLV